MTANEIIFPARDNTIRLLLKKDDVAEDLTNLTRAILKLDGVAIDFDVSPAAFDWTTEGADGILIFKPQTLSLSAGQKKASLIVYDATNINGIVWGTRENYEFDVFIPDTTI